MRHGAKVVFKGKDEMIFRFKLSNNELATLIRLAAKGILKGSDSKFTVEQVLSGLSMNLDYKKQYGYCDFCKNEYPTMDYQGFEFCPHCGSHIGKFGDDL